MQGEWAGGQGRRRCLLKGGEKRTTEGRSGSSIPGGGEVSMPVTVPRK